MPEIKRRPERQSNEPSSLSRSIASRLSQDTRRLRQDFYTITGVKKPLYEINPTLLAKILDVAFHTDETSISQITKHAFITIPDDELFGLMPRSLTEAERRKITTTMTVNQLRHSLILSSSGFFENEPLPLADIKQTLSRIQTFSENHASFSEAVYADLQLYTKALQTMYTPTEYARQLLNQYNFLTPDKRMEILLRGKIGQEVILANPNAKEADLEDMIQKQVADRLKQLHSNDANPKFRNHIEQAEALDNYFGKVITPLEIRRIWGHKALKHLPPDIKHMLS